MPCFLYINFNKNIFLLSFFAEVKIIHYAVFYFLKKAWVLLMSKTEKNNIKVSFVGKAAEQVTGSSFLIETPTKKILVECGFSQGKTLLEDYKNNSQKFKFKPKELDYVILLHGHMDHIGNVPRLYKENCGAKIIIPKGSKELYSLMWEDGAHILLQDSKDLSRKFKKDYEPIYERQHVLLAQSFMEEFAVSEKIKVDEDLEIKYIPSGHIINAFQVEMWVRSINKIVKIAYTSDLGNIKIDNYYTTKFQPITKANLIISENTYNDLIRNKATQKARKKDREKILTVIKQHCMGWGGKVMFPTFSLHRCQLILTELYDLFGEDKNFNIPILIDSPLSIKISKYFLNILEGEQKKKFEKVMTWKNIKKLNEFEENQFYLYGKTPCVFLSASGMMQAGRSVSNAKVLLRDSKNCIVFCGYSIEGSLSWRLKQKKNKTIMIEGEKIPNKANVVILNSFSSHMQRDDLLEYLSNGIFDKIALVHGNWDNKIIFGRDLQELLSKKNKSGKVIIANHSTKINF